MNSSAVYAITMRGNQLPASAARYVLQLLFGEKSQNCNNSLKAEAK